MEKVYFLHEPQTETGTESQPSAGCRVKVEKDTQSAQGVQVRWRHRMARDITSPEETRISQSFKNYMPKAGGVVLMETDKNCPSYEVWRGHGLFFFF